MNTVAVTVLGPGGGPLSTAEVRLWTDHPRSHYSAWRVGDIVSTDAEGLVELELPGGVRFRVHAVHGEFCGASGVRSAFTGGPRSAITLQLEQGVRLRGVVLDAETLEPLAGAKIRLLGIPYHATVVAAADGTFETRPAPESATTFGPGSAWADARAFAKGYAHRSVKVERDDRFLRVTLIRATLVSARLVDESGAPVADLSCKVKSSAGEGSGYAESDESGRVECWLRVDPATPIDVWPDDSQVVRFPGSEARPTARDLGRIVVRTAGEVSGVVVDRSGKPVHGARVWIQPAGDGPSLDYERTDIDGKFDLERVGDGPHVVFAAADGVDEQDAIRIPDVLRGGADLRVVLPVETDD